MAGLANHRRCIYSQAMNDPEIAIPSRAPAAEAADDTMLPFEVAALDLRGRVVRLGPAVDTILAATNIRSRLRSCWARRSCSASCSARR